jgi:hypothetical protein
VRAEYDGEALTVSCTGGKQPEQQTYHVGSGLRFPLELGETLRQRPHRLADEGMALVFDCDREELVRRAYRSLGRRKVELQGEVMEVREVATGSGRLDSEWLDTTCHAVRREVNGPALVALRAAAEPEALPRASVPPAVAHETEGRFGMWLPNPTWRFVATETPGQLTARAGLHEAVITAMLLDGLQSDAALPSAADAVVRWLRLVNPTFALRSRGPVEVRGQGHVRVEGSFVEKRDGRAVRFDAVVHVLAAEHGPLAVCFSAPAGAGEELAVDFARVVEMLELMPRKTSDSRTAAALPPSRRRP